MAFRTLQTNTAITKPTSGFRPLTAAAPTTPAPEIPSEKNNNLLQSVITNTIARPAIRTAQAVGGAIVHASGNKQAIDNYNQFVNKPTVLPAHLGVVDPQKAFGQGGGKQLALDTGKSALDIATFATGVPLDAALTKYGTKALAPTVEKVINSTAPKFIKNVVEKGAKGIVTAGKNLIQGEAYNTGYNAVNEKPLTENATSAGVLSVLAPAVLNTGIKTIKNVRNAFKTEHQINNLEDFYIKNTGGTKSGKKFLDKLGVKTDALNKAGTQGKTAERTLAEHGVMPNVVGTKFDTATQIKDLTAKTKPYKELQQKALAEVEMSTPKIKLSELRNETLAKARSEKNINSGTAKNLTDKINNAFNDLEAEYGSEIPITTLDKIKSARWDNAFGNKALVEADKLAKDADYLIGNVAKDKIEKIAISSGNEHVAQLNREIGDIFNASKLLEKLDGQTIKGGRLGKYVGTMIGSTLGNSVPGKIAGALGGNAMAEFIMKNEASNPLTQYVLRKLEKENPEAYKLTEKWIAQQGKAREARLALPAPSGKSTINQGRPIEVGSKNNTDYVGNQIRVETGQNTLKTPKTTQKALNQQTRYTQQVLNANEASKPMGEIQMGAKPKPKKSNLPVATESPKVFTPEVTRYTAKNPATGGTFKSTKNIEVPKSTQKKTFIQNLKDIPNKQGGFAVGIGYKNEGDLTTKILKDLEGKTTVSKQYILDATNRGELKQTERDITRNVLDTMKGDTINVQEFADKVKAELLPLNIRGASITQKQAKKELDKLGLSFENDLSGDGYIVDKNGEFVDYLDLPKSTQKVIDAYQGGAQNYGELIGNTKYEGVTLPAEQRGNVKNYKEHIWESPIKTKAGSTHFGGSSDSYFGHTRIEDMADNQTRRVIEVQSDLYQKGNLEREVADRFDPAKTQLSKDKANKLFDYTKRLSGQGENLSTKEITEYRKLFDEAKTLHENTVVSSRNKELSKLKQYNDPTAHFRMVREEIKKASQDGKTKLQFPTGETAMKIEGLTGRDELWRNIDNMTTVTPNNIKVGQTISNLNNMSDWIITDVLGNGKFKAVPKQKWDDMDAGIFLYSGEEKRLNELWGKNQSTLTQAEKAERDALFAKADQLKESFQFNREIPDTEQFDISGKVDTNNPIYKFYEKDVQKYLNKFGGKQVVDDKGVSWIEIPITKEQGKMPVEAFGKIQLGVVGTGALVGTGAVAGSKIIQNQKKDNTPKEIPNNRIQVVKTTKTNNGNISQLQSGTEVRDAHPKLVKPIENIYKKNPNLKKGLIEALLMKESSFAYDNTNKNSKRPYAWIGGLTPIAIKDLKQNNIKVNTSTIEGSLQAMVDYWNLRTDPKKSVAENYKNVYSSGKLKEEDLKKFEDMYNYYSKGQKQITRYTK